MDRREFLKKSAAAAAALSPLPLVGKAEAIWPQLLAPQQSGNTPPQANLAVWLKTPIAGLVNNDPIDDSNLWIDSTSNAWPFHGRGATSGTPHYSTAVQINGYNTVKFDGTGSAQHYIVAVISAVEQKITNGWTAATIYIVGKMNADPPAYDFSGLWQAGDSGDYDFAMALPYRVDSHFYDNTFTTVRKDAGNPSASLASNFYYGVISQSGSWEARLNGSSIFSTGTNTFNDNGTDSFRVGINNKGVTTSTFDGYIAEVLVYSSALSGATLTALEAYLAAKYAI